MTSTIDLSCALPPNQDTVRHARAAEELGYTRCWLYDSPALYGDVWIAAARVADATARIGIGIGVGVPSLRHPAVTAAAISDIEESAPGRLVVALGTGYTARLAMGRRPMKWSELAAYLTQLRLLLRGEVAEIDGKKCQMLHEPHCGARRPIETPIILAPSGPKGFEATRQLGVPGVILVALPSRSDLDPDWRLRALIVRGTVLGDDETHRTRRVIEALGPGYATAVHGTWESGPDRLADVPGGSDWLAAVEADRPRDEQHLVVHAGHLCAVTERDRPLVEQAGERLLANAWTGHRTAVADQFDRAAAAGVTEVVYMAMGPDIPGELARMADAFRCAGAACGE